MATDRAGIGRGLWDGDDQALTLRAAQVDLPGEMDEASDLDRASRMLARTLALRRGHPDAANDPPIPTLIVVTRNYRFIGRRLSLKLAPTFNDGSSTLVGKIIVAPPNLSSGYEMDFVNGALGDSIEWLSSHDDLREADTIIINPSATVPALKIYAGGMANDDDYQEFPLYYDDLELARLDELLNTFWQGTVAAPSAVRICEPLWTSGGNPQPLPRPEKTIQKELMRFLRNTLPECYLRDEEDTDLGRLDIRISGPTGINPYTFTHHAVLELKALVGGNKTAPFTDTEAIKKHVEDGVRQAASYCKPPEAARIALLACYDMRPSAGERGETCLDHVRDFAASEKVELRRWPLFPTVELMREFKVPA